MSIVIIYTYRCTLMCTAYMSRRGIILCAPPPPLPPPPGRPPSQWDDAKRIREPHELPQLRTNYRLYLYYVPARWSAVYYTYAPSFGRRGYYFPSILISPRATLSSYFLFHFLFFVIPRPAVASSVLFIFHFSFLHLRATFHLCSVRRFLVYLF